MFASAAHQGQSDYVVALWRQLIRLVPARRDLEVGYDVLTSPQRTGGGGGQECPPPRARRAEALCRAGNGPRPYKVPAC